LSVLNLLLNNPRKLQALLITARNLGDSVIAVSFLRHALDDMPNVVWNVLCRPQVSFLFAHLDNVDSITTAHFPMGTAKQFGLRALIGLGRSLLRLRRLEFVFSADLVGDVREVMLGRFITHGRHYSPGWPPGHPFIRMHYLPFGFLRGRLIGIRAGVVNVYEAYALFSKGIAAKYSAGQAAEESGWLHEERRQQSTTNTSKLRTRPPIVGIHPLASQVCKLWKRENWRELIHAMLQRGYQVFLFGAPNERTQLEALHGEMLDAAAVVTQGMPEFFFRVRELDLLIGLDSFSIHAAHLCGVPAIMINGSNDPLLFCPPNVAILSVVADCGAQPCLNVPRCVGSSYEYICTRGVSVAQVLSEASSILGESCRQADGDEG
jgi:heptosyltransferase-3